MISYADGWYLFWFQWKEETHSYILEAIRAYKGIMGIARLLFYFSKSMRRLQQTPFGGRVTEMPREDEG